MTDRRGWRAVAERLEGRADIVAHDRRGFGESPRSPATFRHVDDLLAVLDDRVREAAWLVGSSRGGGLAVEAAPLAPERVAGLVLIAPAVAGAPPAEELDAEFASLDAALERAAENLDLEETARLVWSRLGELRVPTTVMCGDLDLPSIVEDCRRLADRVAIRRQRVLDGTVHLPCLEAPGMVAGALAEVIFAAPG